VCAHSLFLCYTSLRNFHNFSRPKYIIDSAIAMIIKKTNPLVQNVRQMSVLDPTLTITSRDIIESYAESYRTINLRKPTMRYLGNGWYLVDDEIVHQAIIIQETGRLQQIIRQQSARNMTPEAAQERKGIVQRLIDRLRKM
jgi:hypothetical protein